MYFGVCLSQIGEDRITGAREEEWEAKLRVWDNAHHLVRCSREEEWELRSEEREGRKLRAYTGIDLVERDLRAGDSTLWFDRAQLRVWDNAHHLARCTRDVDISQSTHAVSDSRAAQDFVAFRKGCIRFSNSLVSTKPTSLS